MDLFKKICREYEHGIGTIQGVARKFNVHRRVVRAALKDPVQPKRKVPERTRPKMAPLSPFIDAILQDDQSAPCKARHTAHQIWMRVQAEFSGVDVSESTIRHYVRVKNNELNQVRGQPRPELAASWLIRILRDADPLHRIKGKCPERSELPALARIIRDGRPAQRKKALVILACLRGMRSSIIAECLQIARKTVKRYYSTFEREGLTALFAPRQIKSEDDSEREHFLFSLLHSPPGSRGINRTSWKMDDLYRVLTENGHHTSKRKIRAIIKKSGFKWRRAKVVLTSKDPDYRVKVEAIKGILSELKEDEAFFSIDEYGPFAVKQKGGIKRVAAGDSYVIPQWQRSKGWMILTAALELSKNQVTHFYSLKKNTDEMIKMADLLRIQYYGCRTIYLSWDAASWHISKQLVAHLNEINEQAERDGSPNVKTAPLPAGAQFLNVIESVFSGMAKAVIHNSDYPSVEAAKVAINRYFKDRNEHFSQYPKRAGHKIWGEERVASEFCEGHNCKDPLYR